MISRAHRFHGHNSLNYVYRHGNSCRVEFMALRVAPNKRPDYRMAVVVSKKVSKSAVVRNRIRRRLYEIIRTIKKDADKEWPYDLVLTVHDERIATEDASILHTQVVRLLQKSNVI